MSTARAGMVGVAPSLSITQGDPERAKYVKCWEHDDYRKFAPGEQTASLFLTTAKPSKDAEVIDFGCGSGRGALMIALLGGCRLTMLDFAGNCLDKEVADACVSQPDRIRFIEHNLADPVPVTAKYGYCTDVMEHIPTKKVPKVLANITKSARHCFFQICLKEDHFGQALDIGHLHLTVKPYEWWLAQFKALECVVHWSSYDDNWAMFYVTAWTPGREIVKCGTVNTAQDERDNNVRRNIADKWEQLVPHQRQETEIMILGGGPSLNEFEGEVIANRRDGMPVVTLNGTYNWCIERGITPSAQVIVDSREFNKRFVTPVVDNCKYLISSQVHPSVLKDLPRDRTTLWHTGGLSEEINEFIASYYNDIYFPVPGGSTVMTRAIPLLRMLGFYKFHVYGFDSCLMGEEHHAFSQPENDYENTIRVNCGDRIFKCHAWMASQAQEFIELIENLGDEFQLDVKGDGLIRHIIETGAALALEEES